jgi:hypothetical protein
VRVVYEWHNRKRIGNPRSDTALQDLLGSMAEVDSGQRSPGKTGFELELLGTHAEGTANVSTGCDACVEVSGGRVQ